MVNANDPPKRAAALARLIGKTAPLRLRFVCVERAVLLRQQIRNVAAGVLHSAKDLLGNGQRLPLAGRFNRNDNTTIADRKSVV